MAEKYSFEIAEEIQQFLEQDDWHFEFLEEKGMFHFRVNVSGKLKKIEYVLQVREDDYLVYTICPLNADKDDPEAMQRINEFLACANYGTVNGNFEMDYSDGEIRYKVYVNCKDMLPSSRVIRDSIYIPATSWKQYGDAIVQLMFTEASTEDAYKNCRKKFLKQLMEQYMRPDDNDYEEME
ncbi:MAG: hypothetical protein IJJ69_13805 [Oscillospiraceae bacterium]|nr:hypothetical protein [Oscillospiraceae bacterium]